MAKTRKVDLPLRKDVRFLGKLLGDVLKEQEGEALFALEERVRKAAIKRRRGPVEGRAAAAAELASLVEGIPLEQVEPILRAFSVYFQLANLAEQHHRVRRSRAHASEETTQPQRGSLAAVLRTCQEKGFTAEQVRAALRSLEVTLTFTAHPTQASRRTVLEKLDRITRRLEERDRCELTPVEERRAALLMREEVTALWQTDEVRHERPTVGDEVKNVLWYIEEVLWDLLPELPLALDEAFSRAFGEPLGFVPSPLRLHSWVGGDMDGHPGVTPRVVEDAIRAYQTRCLRRILTELQALGGALSQSSRRVEVPRALLDSIAEDEARMPEIATRQRPRTEGEPWRRKLRFMEARLSFTLSSVELKRLLAEREENVDPAERFDREPHPCAYESAAGLEQDLQLVADTLHQVKADHAGERQVRALLHRVRAMGFQLAELELRVPADDARDAAASVADRSVPSEGGARVLSALQRVAEAQQHEGKECACRTLILSMAMSAKDVLAALECAKASGLSNDAGGANLDVVPLFETLGALDDGPAILEALFKDPVYLRHVKQRGYQEVMVGYSDSGKEVGLLAASAALRRAQVRLPRVGAAAGIPIRIFHGRGESVARGGGPAQQAILSLPKGSVAGRYKATEQGEAMDHKYARPELARRTLELIIGGALLHTLGGEEEASPSDEARFMGIFDELAETGRKAWRALVWDDPQFTPFFTAATPIDEIARLPIGSRPSKRRAGGIEALRAIPWVFAWTQNRAIVPGFYGVGTAFETFARKPEGAAQLEELVRRWPFFKSVLDNIEMVLGKSDLAIAERYASLAPPEARAAIWPKIAAEHALTRKWLKQLTGHRRLLDGNPPLQRSIALRNPYVDPMSYLQVELLKRRRAGDERCDRPLLLTLSGIAAGMRNTG